MALPFQIIICIKAVSLLPMECDWEWFSRAIEVTLKDMGKIDITECIVGMYCITRTAIRCRPDLYMCLILWGFRHFAICFCYDWIAKGDGKMGAPSRRESSVYLFMYIYIRVRVYVCVWKCVYMFKRVHVHACVYLYINEFCFVLCL